MAGRKLPETPKPEPAPLPALPVWVDAVVLAAVYFSLLALTWRKWPDLLVDFGRELYLPWRIVSGDVLYRDILHYYGPLGSYANALWFRLFGVGYTTVIGANIGLSLALTSLLRWVLGRMAGRVAGMAAALSFLAIFCFGNYVGIGNYNFLSPYSHDVTYGTFLCVALLPLHWFHLRTRRRLLLAGAGFVWGLAYLTKPEITLAAASVSGMFFVAIAVREIRGIGPGRGPGAVLGSLALDVCCWLGAAIVPAGLFTLGFLRAMPAHDAIRAVHSGWLTILESREMREAHAIQTFMGTDNPGRSLMTHAGATLAAVLAIAMGAGLALLTGTKIRERGVRAGIAVAAGFGAAAAALAVNWLEFSGRILLLGNAAIWVWHVARLLRIPPGHADWTTIAARAAWSALAVALMAKMVLNGRVYHYGFFQAMPAFLGLVCFLLADFPAWLRTRGAADIVFRGAVLGLLAVALLSIFSVARKRYALKNYRAGSGADTIITYNPRISGIGPIFNALLGEIATKHAGADSLAVIPEGVGLNYLARLRTPGTFFEYAPATVALYGQDRMLAALESNPPDLVVLISRDISEFGFAYFGSEEASGKRILDWVQSHYELAGKIGGHPLNPAEQGAYLLKLKPASN